MPDLNKIVEDLSKLTVVEAAELSKTLEEKWGVSKKSNYQWISQKKHLKMNNF